MRAGELDRHVTILAPQKTANSMNELVVSFTEQATIRARKHDVSAGEAWRAQEVGAKISTRFTIRWSSIVAMMDPQYRIRFEARDYEITAIREIGRRQWLEIDAVARAES